MFYRGMPDTYEYNHKDHWRETLHQVFWYEGEFHLLDKSTDTIRRNPRYFEDVNELLGVMLEIAPYKDWKRVDYPSR